MVADRQAIDLSLVTRPWFYDVAKLICFTRTGLRLAESGQSAYKSVLAYIGRAISRADSQGSFT